MIEMDTNLKHIIFIRKDAQQMIGSNQNSKSELPNEK